MTLKSFSMGQFNLVIVDLMLDGCLTFVIIYYLLTFKFGDTNTQQRIYMTQNLIHSYNYKTYVLDMYTVFHTIVCIHDGSSSLHVSLLIGPFTGTCVLPFYKICRQCWFPSILVSINISIIESKGNEDGEGSSQTPLYLQQILFFPV